MSYHELTDEEVLEQAAATQASVSQTHRAADLHNAVNAVITVWRESTKDADPEKQIEALAKNFLHGKIEQLETAYAIYTDSFVDLVKRRMRNEC